MKLSKFDEAVLLIEAATTPGVRPEAIEAFFLLLRKKWCDKLQTLIKTKLNNTEVEFLSKKGYLQHALSHCHSN